MNLSSYPNARLSPSPAGVEASCWSQGKAEGGKGKEAWEPMNSFSLSNFYSPLSADRRGGTPVALIHFMYFKYIWAAKFPWSADFFHHSTAFFGSFSTPLPSW